MLLLYVWEERTSISSVASQHFLSYPPPSVSVVRKRRPLHVCHMQVGVRSAVTVAMTLGVIMQSCSITQVT